jgi:hypothetical protein
MKQLLLFLGLVFAISTCPIQAQSTATTNNLANQDAEIPVTSADSQEIDTFQRLEDNWSISVRHRDEYGLELVMSPLFTGVSSTGEITTRDQLVARLVNSDDKTLALEFHVETVRMLGDVAVVNGTYAFNRHVNGNAVDERGVYTHVYQKVHAGWLCINSQRTQLHENTPSKQQKKKSESELGFHIPLFSKN